MQPLQPHLRAANSVDVADSVFSNIPKKSNSVALVATKEFAAAGPSDVEPHKRTTCSYNATVRKVWEYSTPCIPWVKVTESTAVQ